MFKHSTFSSIGLFLAALWLFPILDVFYREAPQGTQPEPLLTLTGSFVAVPNVDRLPFLFCGVPPSSQSEPILAVVGCVWCPTQGSGMFSLETTTEQPARANTGSGWLHVVLPNAGT